MQKTSGFRGLPATTALALLALSSAGAFAQETSKNSFAVLSSIVHVIVAVVITAGVLAFCAVLYKQNQKTKAQQRKRHQAREVALKSVNNATELISKKLAVEVFRPKPPSFVRPEPKRSRQFKRSNYNN